MVTKLHAVTDDEVRSLRFFMTAGHVSDYTGGAALLGSLPEADRNLPAEKLRLLRALTSKRA